MKFLLILLLLVTSLWAKDNKSFYKESIENKHNTYLSFKGRYDVNTPDSICQRRALVELSSNRKSKVSAGEMLSEQYKSNGVAISDYSKTIQTQTQVLLQNIHYLGWRDKNYKYCVAYVSLESLKKVQASIVTEATSMHSLIIGANDVNRKLSLLIDLGALANYSVRPIKVGSILNIKLWAQEEFIKIFGEVQIQIGQPVSKSGEITSSIQLVWQGQKLKNLGIMEEDGKIFPVVMTTNSTMINFQDLPTGLIQEYVIQINHVKNSDEEAHYLDELVLKRKVFVDFSNIIELDFKWEYQGLDGQDFVVNFYPETKNLNVSEWKWEFGDGTSSQEGEPLKSYSEKKSYQVTLTFNQDEKLKLTRHIGPKHNSTQPLAPVTPVTPLTTVVPITPKYNTHVKPPSTMSQVLEIEKTILNISSLTDLETSLETLEGRGKISILKNTARYRHPRSLKELKSKTKPYYVLIIHPKTGQIVDVLTSGLEAKSIKTGLALKQTQVNWPRPNFSVIWIRLNIKNL